MEELDFANLEELRHYSELPPRVTNFRISLSDWRKGRYLVITSASPFSKAKVSATGEKVAWSAGIVDAVFSFMQLHRLWYSWFLSVPAYWALYLIVVTVPWAWVATSDPTVKQLVVIIWAVAFLLYVLHIFNERLLPSAVIRISESEGFVRKYATELGLAIAAVGVIAAVVALFR
jgi:hypothetical protein